MNKTLRIAMFVLLMTMLSLATWFMFHSREPKCEGEPLRVWLAKLLPDESTADPEAVRAVRTIGTNAIPLLLEYVSAFDQPVKREFARWVGKQNVIDLKFRWAEEDHYYAVAGFWALGELGTPAIPALVTLMNDTNAGAAAVECLAAIGTNGTSHLLVGLTHTNADIRRACAWHLGGVGTNTPLVVPSLIARLQDPDVTVVMVAAMTLGRLRLAPDQVVPSLTKMLTQSDWRISGTAADALGNFGTNALSALPGLMLAFEDCPGNYLALFARAIENISPGESIPHLIELSRYKDSRTAGRAISILRLAGVRALPAVPTLLARADREEDARLAKAASVAAQTILTQWRTNATPEQVECYAGGVIRGSRIERRISLMFAGHAYAEGGETILDELQRHKAHGSFFFSPDFLASKNFNLLIRRCIGEGHYLGPHPNQQPANRSGDNSQSTLVRHWDFTFDLEKNLEKLETFGIARSRIRYCLPPIDQSRVQFADSSLAEGATLINFTPGTQSNADDTREADPNFVSSQAIFDSILQRERENPHGLNGFILLFHLGSGPGRADKFHPRFGELLDYLTAKGYQFVRVDELLEPKPEMEKGKAD